MIEAFAFQRADVFAEQREHQGLLRADDLQSQQQDPAKGQPQDADDHHQGAQRAGHVADARADQQEKRCDVEHDDSDENGHAVLSFVENDFVHILNTVLLKNVNVFDIKIISQRYFLSRAILL